MDKNAIKKYAVWARRELISRVTQKALQYGITKKEMQPADASSVNGVVLSAKEKKQRRALIAKINEEGFEQVMEEVAYTWFNRFSALRFMEVNGYLPTHVRVFTDEENNFKPQILAEAINLEIEGLDMEKVYALKEANDNDTLFKYLIITQCNALSAILPGMFQKIDDYTELLFPDNLLREGSAIEQMIATIPEEDWQDAVQIIGWLYQYYNIELFDAIFDGVQQKKSLTYEEVPSATQLFTPDWSVRYMVENSLGRLWLEGHPNDQLQSKWKYYLNEAEQEADVRNRLEVIRGEYALLSPEQLKCVDPCSGSGHICAYMFDVLVQIYETYGYSAREAASSIVENNLYGLDIDERAAQLAYFSVMMKARQYDRRFFTRGIQPRIYSIKESNNLDAFSVDYFCDGRPEVKSAMNTLIEELHGAKEYGSILRVTSVDFSALYTRIEEVREDMHICREYVLNDLLPFIQCAEALAQKYDVVVTNPPYMSSARMNSKLTKYVADNYQEGKADMASVMYLATQQNLLKKNGFISFITTNSWMFLKSFLKVREISMNCLSFDSIVDYGTELFDGKIGHLPIIAWVARKAVIDKRITAIRLVEFCYSRRNEKFTEYFNKANYYYISQSAFMAIEGAPIVYWLSEASKRNFSNEKKVIDYARPRVGQNTGDNDRFLRQWYEVDFHRIGFATEHDDLETSSCKWIPYNKGGAFRRWYGNFDYIVNWENDGKEIKEYAVIRNHGKHWSRYIQNIENLCKPGISWSDIATTRFGCRFLPEGFICDVKGSSMFPPEEYRYYLLAFLNSKIAISYLQMLNPTTTFQVGNISALPLIVKRKDEIEKLARENVEIARADWDSCETSWDFQHHPLLPLGPRSAECSYKIKDLYEKWEVLCEERFNRLKQNEEDLNRIFIDIYGLKDELVPEVKDQDVSVRVADKQQDIRSLISFAVGCMFGRYSLNHDGLIYAGGEWEEKQYHHFLADKDNIIPICDDEYFEDDIVGRFIEFIKIAYGENTLAENLLFISNALGGKGSARDIIRNYFLNNFFAEHLKNYQKRPIYWLFDSGKKNGFKALVYAHRYQPDTIARMRTDYVHEQQSRYRTVIADLLQRSERASTSERVKLSRQLKKLQDQADEIHEFEEKIHHLADQYISLDLDDGIMKNYDSLGDVLAKRK